MKYVIGSCRGCCGIIAIGKTNTEIVAFVERGLSVEIIESDDRVTLEGHAELCSMDNTVKEIRPQKEGEVWRHKETTYLVQSGSGRPWMVSQHGTSGHADPEVIHGENGWIKVDPPVPDDSVAK